MGLSQTAFTLTTRLFVFFAFRAYPHGLVLVTDAISAMGLSSGVYRIGSQSIEIFGNRAVLAGTNTLWGSIATMDECVRLLKSSVETLECATLHPAQVWRISDHKGSALRSGR